MKRKILICILGILLMVVLTAVVSGERIAEKTEAVTRQTTVVEDTEGIPTSGVESNSGSTIETIEIDLLSVNKTAEANVYEIPWQSINAGGEDLSSANYEMSSSIGQSVIGYASSANYENGIGYWYGMDDGGGDCVCGTPVGDVNCDAAVNPVDVVYMVNYVYKNQDARCYPGGWNCTYDLGDVDCNGGVNPVDVVYFVNYVYKNQDAFCDPCSQ